MDAVRPPCKIAVDYGVGKTQIQKQRKKFENNISGTSNRRHATGNEVINHQCLVWIKDAVHRRIVVNGPLLITKALTSSAC